MNEQTEKKMRSASETLYLNFLMHIGFSSPLLIDANIRGDKERFGRRAVHRAEEAIKTTLAHEKHGWPVAPRNKVPGKAVISNFQLIEISMLSAAMYCLHQDKIYEGLSMAEIIDAYDMYVNVRKTANNDCDQISPDTAYWLSREFMSHTAVLAYCPSCNIRYYSGEEQRISHRCPFCKGKGHGDVYSDPITNNLSKYAKADRKAA